MSTPSHYTSRIEQILGGSFVDGVLEVTMSGKESDAKETINKIRRMQRDLRILRKEVRLECGEIKACFPPNLSQSMRQQRQLMLAPYDALTNTIDKALVSLDKGKASIHDVLNGEASAA